MFLIMVHSPAPLKGKKATGTLKALRNLLTGQRGNLIRSAPNTLLASGPEIPRTVCVPLKSSGSESHEPNHTFPTTQPLENKKDFVTKVSVLKLSKYIAQLHIHLKLIQSFFFFFFSFQLWSTNYSQ